MSEGPGPERRTTARKACLLQARYRRGATWHPATLVDLSTSGCRLRVGEDLPRGGELRLALARPPEGGERPIEVEVSGIVIWSRLEGLSHQAGLQFSAGAAPLEKLVASLA